jgi:hypothetical protein
MSDHGFDPALRVLLLPGGWLDSGPGDWPAGLERLRALCVATR